MSGDDGHTFTSARLMKAFRDYPVCEQEDGRAVGFIRNGLYGRHSQQSRREMLDWKGRQLFVSGVRGCPSGVGMTRPTEARHNPGLGGQEHLVVLTS